MAGNAPISEPEISHENVQQNQSRVTTSWTCSRCTRVRDRWVGRRTSVINQIRGLLLERAESIYGSPHAIND